MNDENCREISEALLKVMCKADEEFQEQLAMGIGVSVETFKEYLDTVDFSNVTALES